MIWLALAIAAWGAVHSWMASLGFKEALRRVMGENARRFYRLAYNAFSFLTLAPILLFLRALPDHKLYAVPLPWAALMVAGQIAAVVCIMLAVLQVDAASFIGLRQLFEGDEPAPRLVTSGLYRWVRHPLYLFGLLILWLTPLMTANLLLLYLSFSAYFIIGALFEERKLSREFGSAYADYKSRTPMLIPFIGRARQH